MSYNLNELGFMQKYENIKQLVDVEVTPLIDILLKLSNIANNFSSTANRIANIDIRETHEIKEFLELTFEARKLAKKVQDVAEYRTEVVVEASMFCYYETRPPKKPEGSHDKDIDAIVAAGNKIVNKNITTNKGNEKNQDKKGGKEGEKKDIKNLDENIKDKKEKTEKEDVKPNPKEKLQDTGDKGKRETDKRETESDDDK